MIIVDTALARRAEAGNPIRVGLVGAGFMGRGVARQILTAVPGMQLVAICNRTVAAAERAYREAGVRDLRRASSVLDLQLAIEAGHYAVTDDADALCRAEGIEAIVEATSDLEFGARVALAAITNGKHVILMNAEVDASLGPILKAYADRAGVVYTYTDGDEPGVAMNLIRFVRSTGYQPVLAGQIKGFLDHYRTPATQQSFAEKYQQQPTMIASYADGSKLALEATILGNGTGFRPAVRGMHGHPCVHVKDLLAKFDPADFASGGIVDFALGGEPHTGAFVVAYNDDPVKKSYMSYFKAGDGPLYIFYTPYHYAHLQVPHSVARAVLFADPTLTPVGSPTCDTVSMAKRDLKAGDVLDGPGGFCCYGLVETYTNCRKGDFLPIALSKNCRVRRDVPKDQPIGYADVELPHGRVCDLLRAEQIERFPAKD